MANSRSQKCKDLKYYRKGVIFFDPTKSMINTLIRQLYQHVLLYFCLFKELNPLLEDVV